MTDKEPEEPITNSHKSKEAAEEPKNKKRKARKRPERPERPPLPVEGPDIHPVVSGKVVNTKPSWGKRVRNFLLPGDVNTVGQFVFQDVVVPTIRDLVYDALRLGGERMLYGDVEPRPVRRGRSGLQSRLTYPEDYEPMTPYHRQRGRVEPPRGRRRRANLPDQPSPNHGFVNTQNRFDLTFSSQRDAEAILRGMHDVLSSYDCVSVADLRGFAGLDVDWPDYDWGWFEMPRATIHQSRNGWVLNLPSPEQIN